MLDRQQHETILKNILKDIYKDKTLSTSLMFKGGTALYMFYGLDRFSTDLDFNIVSDDYEDIFKRLESIVLRYGEVKNSRIKNNTVFFLISYDKDKQKIKIEASKREYGDKYEIKNFLGIPVPVMIKENMFAHKLVALTERKKIANRDLYDIEWMFKKMWDINESIIKDRTGKNLVEYLKVCIKYIEENVSGKDILDGLGEVVSAEKKQRVKENLKFDIIFSLKVFIDSLEKK